MRDDREYELVRLGNGAHSVRSTAHGETMHPGLGPRAEAETLYVRQLRLVERMREHDGEFVIWDVGLGAAANALATVQATASCATPLRLISFDHTLNPLRFAFTQRDALGYFGGCEDLVQDLLVQGRATGIHGGRSLAWEVVTGDFPTLLGSAHRKQWPSPHAILFDPWSPSKNPGMWTAQVFSELFQCLEPGRDCALATYSRSTMLRVSLLLAGFFVGAGHGAGRKEETTLAASSRALIPELLDPRWLERARRSPAAEPLREAVYRQAPLAVETWEQLRAHRQFTPQPS